MLLLRVHIGPPTPVPAHNAIKMDEQLFQYSMDVDPAVDIVAPLVSFTCTPVMGDNFAGLVEGWRYERSAGLQNRTEPSGEQPPANCCHKPISTLMFTIHDEDAGEQDILKEMFKEAKQQSVFSRISCSSFFLSCDSLSGEKWIRWAAVEPNREYVVQEIFVAYDSFMVNGITPADIIMYRMGPDFDPADSLTLQRMHAGIMGDLCVMGNTFHDRIDAVYPDAQAAFSSEPSEFIGALLCAEDTPVFWPKPSKHFLTPPCKVRRTADMDFKFRPHIWMTDPRVFKWTETLSDVLRSRELSYREVVIGAKSEVVQWRKDGYDCVSGMSQLLRFHSMHPQRYSLIMIVLQSAMEHIEIVTAAVRMFSKCDIVPVFVPTAPVLSLPPASLSAIAHLIGAPMPLSMPSKDIIRTSLAVYSTTLPQFAANKSTAHALRDTIFEDAFQDCTPILAHQNAWNAEVEDWLQPTVVGMAPPAGRIVCRMLTGLEEPAHPPMSISTVRIAAPANAQTERLYRTLLSAQCNPLVHMFVTIDLARLHQCLENIDYTEADDTAKGILHTINMARPNVVVEPEASGLLVDSPISASIEATDVPLPEATTCDLCYDCSAGDMLAVACCKNKFICRECAFRHFSSANQTCPWCRDGKPRLASPSLTEESKFVTGNRDVAIMHALGKISMWERRTDTQGIIVLSHSAELMNTIRGAFITPVIAPVTKTACPETYFNAPPGRRMLFMPYKKVSNMDFTGHTVILCDPWFRELKFWLRCEKLYLIYHQTPFMAFCWRTMPDTPHAYCPLTKMIVGIEPRVSGDHDLM